jgi:hypothetical protein
MDRGRRGRLLGVIVVFELSTIAVHIDGLNQKLAGLTRMLETQRKGTKQQLAQMRDHLSKTNEAVGEIRFRVALRVRTEEEIKREWDRL